MSESSVADSLAGELRTASAAPAADRWSAGALAEGTGGLIGLGLPMVERRARPHAQLAPHPAHPLPAQRVPHLASQPASHPSAHTAAHTAAYTTGALRSALAPQPQAQVHLQGGVRLHPEPADAGLAERLHQVLDLLEYGVLIVGADARVLHSNRAAQAALDQGHALQVEGGLLHVRSAADATALREAIQQAALRGLRKLLALSGRDQPDAVAVVPLAPLPGEGQHGVALMLSRREVCEPLTVEWYARANRLTMAETAVVKGLCADLTPQEIAERQGVGLATVRSQIGAIRHKTGACSIRAVLRQLSLLPPLVSVLQFGGAAPAAGSRAARPQAGLRV